MARILIVEKDASVRKTLKHILMLQGHLVASTGNGRQALALNEELAPDLVLVDMRLSDLNGLALVQSLRHAVHGLRIVAMAGADDPADLAARVGVDASLVKPFAVAELLDTLALQAA